MTLIQDGCGLPITETGLLLRAGGQDFPQLLGMWPQLMSFANRRKIEPEETPSCLIPHLLVIFTQQLKILVTTLTKCSISTILPNNRGPWTVLEKSNNYIYIFFSSPFISERESLLRKLQNIAVKDRKENHDPNWLSQWTGPA